MITNRFSKDRPVSMAQGRYGELIVVQGGGVRPARWTGQGEAVDAGMDAPTVPPSLSASLTPMYYIARVDVTKPGAVYYAPPPITFEQQSSANSQAAKHRPARAQSFLSQSSVSEIAVLDGGKYYPDAPTTLLGDTHGKGAEIEAVLDEPPDDPTNSRKTGITTWEIVEESTGARYAGQEGSDYYVTVNGDGTVFLGSGNWYRNNEPNPGYTCGTGGATGIRGYDRNVRIEATGWKSGTGATCRLKWTGASWIASCASFGASSFFYEGATGLRDATAHRYGAGYADDTKIRLTIYPCAGDTSQRIVVEGMTRGHPDNDGAERYVIKELKLLNGGSGYVVAPQLKITSDSGFGAYATCTVKNGKIDTVTLENSGGGYKTPPKVEILSGGAEAFAVARPHLRGKYQCYYRYVDDTPKDRGGPLPSVLSEVKEVDAGEGASYVSWSVPSPSGRAKKVELWRSTSNQATTLYRVATLDAASGYLDDLTDEELRNPDRDGYEAMPIILPNGEINAMRFVPPPSDKSVAVRFQDRFWYGVDTGGNEPNTLYFSEVDEPESVPKENQLVLQQNARDSDSVRALIPFGASLLVMQSRHAFSLTFARQPLLDAQVRPVAFRGALNQRCWDIYAGVCYVLDQYGVYAITESGQIEPLSDAIDDAFTTHIDFGKSTWNFLVIDAKRKVLRAFVALKDDASAGYPTAALCYHIESKTWWVERYPQQVTSGTQVRLSNGDFRCVYGAKGGVYLLGEGAADAGRGAVVAVKLTNAGNGYKSPPTVTASGGVGAEFEAVVGGDGRLTCIYIKSVGYGYTSGQLFVSPPDDPTCTAPVRATAEYMATPLTQDTPLFPTYRYRSGFAEYTTDLNEQEGADARRTVGLLYQPQAAPCDVTLRLYYNGAKHPRTHTADRDRGAGFRCSAVDGAARLNMGAASADNGFANAVYSGRTIDDMRGGDRNVSVELAGASKTPDPVVFYRLDVYGTTE